MRTTTSADTVKSNVTIYELLTMLGRDGAVVRLAENSFGLNPCPSCNHKDSFRWRTNHGTHDLFKCFSGSCNFAGDIWTLFDVLKPGFSFPEAVAFVAEQAGIVATTTIKSAKKSKANKQAQGKHSILTQAVLFYRDNIKNSTFTNWQKKRKYKPEILTLHSIGFSGGKVFLHEHLKKHGYSAEEMIASGLVRRDKKKGHLYDLFYKPAIVFPYHDKNSAVQHIKAKLVDEQGNHVGNPYQLKTTPTTPVFFGMQNFPDTNKKDALYIVEGETDVLAMSHMGVIAWGLGKLLSKIQQDYIGSMIHEGYSIISTFDNDEAGQVYHDKLIQYASMPEIITAKTDDKYGHLLHAAIPCNYKDPDEAFRAADTDWVKLVRPVFTGLRTCLYSYRSTISADDKWSADAIARILFDWFDASGTWYVKQDEIFLTYEGMAYTLDTKLPFKALLYRMAGINYATKSSKATWEALSAIAYSEAKHVDGASWLHNQHDPPSTSWHIGNNNIATMFQGRVSVSIAGSGSVMLLESPKMLPVKFLQNDEGSTQKGLQKLFKFTGTAMACAQPWQLYLCALFIKTLFLGWSRAQGIHNFTGSMGSGKSDAANFLTVLTYGQTFVTAGSTASNYTDATQNPWTVLDNLESRNVGNDVRDFLLHVATGIVRQKRKAGTDSENVYERARTQVLTTSIEQTETPELIERTIIIPFGHRWFSSDHPGSSILEESVIRKRNLILSAMMRLTADILPTFSEKRAEYLDWIQKQYPKHSKKRLNEHIATIATITDAMLEACPDHPFRLDSAKNALEYWITEQNVIAIDLTADSNPIIRYLDLLEKEWRLKNTDMDFLETPNQLCAEATLAELLSEFDMIAKQYQIKDRYQSVRHLSVRIVNENEVLRRAGWEITKKCIIRGRPVYSICRNYDNDI